MSLLFVLLLVTWPFLACSSRSIFAGRRSVTTESIFNDFTRWATQDPETTFDSTSSVGIRELFACFDTAEGTENSLLHSQNGAWSGFAEYAKTYFHNIILKNPRDGTDTNTTDEWGSRCFPSPTNPGQLECQAPNPSVGWSECPEEETCEPENIPVVLSDNTTLDIEIYEPCNMLSNLAYYRAIPEICAANLFASHETSGISSDATALSHAMAGLAFFSSFFHGSNTYLGSIGDTRMIDIVSLINHQVLVGALIQAHPGFNQSQSNTLFHLKDTPRTQTGAEIALQVTDMLGNFDTSEWAQSILDLDVPTFRETFSALSATVLTLMFPQREELVEDIMLALSNVLDSGTEGAESLNLLPIARSLTSNLRLSRSERFVLLRQFLGTAFKLLYSFLWQEQVIQLPSFLDEGPNKVGADIMPTLMSLFNFITGYNHVDQQFQNAEDVYPGDKTCRLQPHAKWHEVSANGLMDLAFFVDCARSSVTGGAFNCATLSGINGMDSISLNDVRSWVYSAFPEESSNFFLGKTFEIAILAVWLPLDKNFDGRIDYTDIEHVVDDIEDWIQFIQGVLSWWDGFMADLNKIAETVKCTLDPVCIGDTIGACVTDDMCPGNEECVFLSCGLQKAGEPCLFDSDCLGGSCGLFTCGLQGNGEPCFLESDCASGRCEWGSFTCRAKAGAGAKCNEDNDCITGVCSGGHGFIEGVCGKQPNGSSCLEDSDCESGRCDGYVWDRTCQPRKPNGSDCNEDTDCQSGRCEGWYGFAKCRAKVGTGSSCNEGSDCISGYCRKNWWGSGKCS